MLICKFEKLGSGWWKLERHMQNESLDRYRILYVLCSNLSNSPPALLSVFGSMMTNSGRSLLMRLPLRIGTSPPKYSR